MGTFEHSSLRAARERKLWLLGIVLCGAMLLCAHYAGDRGGPRFMAALAVAEIAYLVAVWDLLAVPGVGRRLVIGGLAFAAMWHVAFLRVPTAIDDDVRRYVWDGRLQRLGHNPYVVVPGDPAVEALHTSETRTLNNPNLPTVYPPGAELFFRAVTSVRESTAAMRVAFVLCEVAIGAVLLAGMGDRRSHLVLAFAWNPLLGIEVAGSGHIDIFGSLLLLVSAVALMRRWKATAAVALGLAVAVKFLPVVLLPLYWGRVRVRDAVLTAMVVGLLCVPFLEHGRLPTGSLGTYVRSFRFNGPVFAALDRLVPVQALAALALLAGIAVAIWFRRKQSEPTAAAFAWSMAASLVCAPAIFPWYLLWLLPFLRARATFLLVLWTATIVPVYVMWHLRAEGRSWGTLPLWVMVVEYAPLLLAAGVYVRVTKADVEAGGGL